MPAGWYILRMNTTTRSSWTHSRRPDHHEVPALTLTRFEDGASLCRICGGEVELTPAAARRLEVEVAQRTADYHALLLGNGARLGSAYGACSSLCSHEAA